jgi:DeoR family transcriptional regulator, fructose operon transcriptional repressor
MTNHDAAGDSTMSANATDTTGAELPAVRRDRIAAHVELVRQASVHEIAEQFDVSPDTVRRDLIELHDLGLLTRTRGGAVANTVLTSPDRELRIRQELQEQEKTRIGEYAARLIQNEAIVAFNGGTTTLAVARALGQHRGLTVATNSLSIPFEIATAAVKSLYVFGGEVRFSSQVTVGAASFPDGAAEGAVHFDIAILGVGGLTPEGFSVSNLAEAGMMRQLAGRTSRVVVVADSTKIARTQFALVAGLDGIDDLVIDVPLPPSLAAACDEANVVVHVVDESGTRGPRR